MPTYEYRRPDGTTFDVFQKISADPLTHDPETGVPVQRVISGGAGLQFKGDGFYLTDYVRKKGNGTDTDAKSESATDASSDKTSSTTTTTTTKPSGGSSASASDG